MSLHFQEFPNPLFHWKKKNTSAGGKVREQVKTSELSCTAKLSSPQHRFCSPYSPRGNWNLCLSVSEIRNCQGEGRKFTYLGMEAGLYIQTKLAACFSSQGLSRAISTSGVTQPSSYAQAAFQTQTGQFPCSDRAQLHSCASPALCDPRAVTATSTVLCQGRDSGDRDSQHCLPSWEARLKEQQPRGGCLRLCFATHKDASKKKPQRCKTWT